MMIMRNTNRLIDDFKSQTMNSVWKHLNHDVYIYCTDYNVVVLCLDCCGLSEEQTYEESETLSPLIMDEGCEPRVSVVWKLAETVRHIKASLQTTNPLVNVHGVLLTEANILNTYELDGLWNEHNVTVIDCLKRLK